MEDWQDYYDYLCRYNERSGGLPADIGSRMTEYALDSSKLANDLSEGYAEIILLFPLASSSRGSSGQIGLLHQCIIGEQLTDITGIPDLRRHTPPRSVAFGSLVRPFSVPSGNQDDLVPTVAQLAEASSYEEFVSLRGNKDDRAASLESIPAFVRLHPAAASHFLPLGDDLSSESILNEFISTMKDFTGDRRETALEGQGPLLLFLWAVGNGFVGTRARFKQPSYLELAEVTERATDRFQKLKGESSAFGSSNGKVAGGGRDVSGGEREEADSYQEGNGDAEGERENPRDTAEQRGRETVDRTRNQRRSRSTSDNSEGRNKKRTPKSRSVSRDHRRKKSRRRRRSGSSSSDGSSDPSSSSSDSSSDSSRSSYSSRDRRKKSRRKSNRRARRRNEAQRNSTAEQRSQPHRSATGGADLSDLLVEMRGFLATTCDYQRASTLRMDQDRMDRSTIGQYAERQKFLARYLAAKDYRDENPSMSRSLQELLATRNPLTQWQMIEDMVSDARPPGIISQSGVTQFLSKGFLDENQPGGFTLFMFSPFRKISRRLNQRKKDIKLAYGEVGKLSEEDVDSLAKNGYYLPVSMSEAKDMLQVGVWFLEKLTVRKGIASEGYREGLKLVKDYGDRLREAAERDSGFPAKFLGYLDTLFQHFCRELKDFSNRSSPLYRAKRHLRGFMANEVKDTFKNLKIYGIVPQLNHPVIDDEGNGQDPSSEDRKIPSGDKPPEWYTKNPAPEPAWKTPDGKRHGDFFNTSSQTGKENVARLPQCKHHRTGRMQTVCAKYQAAGKCIASCRQSHIRASDMDDELKKQLDEAFSQAYKST